MSRTMTLRPYLLTDMEAETLYDCLTAASKLPGLSDDALIYVLALRDRFKPEENPS